MIYIVQFEKIHGNVNEVTCAYEPVRNMKGSQNREMQRLYSTKITIFMSNLMNEAMRESKRTIVDDTIKVIYTI